jgi:LysM repeat protein
MDKWRKWIVADVALILVSAQILHAQMGDPSAREDEAIERQKILKAADQIDLLVQQNQKLQEDLGKLQQQVTVLQDEKGALLRRLDEIEKNAVKDKQSLLKEVAAIVASKPSGTNPPAPTSVAFKQEKAPPTAKQDGYEYEVKAGDSLWAISKAYQDAGVKVSVEEIRKANNMEKSQDLRVGQKLFVPKN